MRKKILLVLLVAMTTMLMSSCTASRCAVAQKTLSSAEIALARANANGNLQQIQKYQWTLEAAEAIRIMWCAGVEDGVVP